MSQPLSDLRAICFDLDDTLCSYWAACRAGLAATFSAFPVGGKSESELLVEWATAYRSFCPHIEKMGWYDRYLQSGAHTRIETMRLLLLQLGIDDPNLAAEMGTFYGEARLQALVPFEGAIEGVRELATRFPLGLITNGPADVQRSEIARLGIGQIFDPILIEGEMGFGKPDPKVFSLAATRLGLAPEHLLMVGNSYRHDIRPAIRAGWKAIWIHSEGDIPPSTEGLARKPLTHLDDEPKATWVVSTIAEAIALINQST